MMFTSGMRKQQNDGFSSFCVHRNDLHNPELRNNKNLSFRRFCIASVHTLVANMYFNILAFLHVISYRILPNLK